MVWYVMGAVRKKLDSNSIVPNLGLRNIQNVTGRGINKIFLIPREVDIYACTVSCCQGCTIVITIFAAALKHHSL